MYGVQSKRENAHEDSIWSCAWGRRSLTEEHDKGVSSEDGDLQVEKERVVIGTEDILATGGVDNMVRVWSYHDGEIKLKHKLSDHSLGVVSVALSHDAECK